MPTLDIKMLEGHTQEQKRMLVEPVAMAVCESLGADRATIDVVIQEFKRDSTARGGRFFSDAEEKTSTRT